MDISTLTFELARTLTIEALGPKMIVWDPPVRMCKNAVKTEHTGLKCCKGFWDTKKAAKSLCKRLRRRNDKQACLAR